MCRIFEYLFFLVSTINPCKRPYRIFWCRFIDKCQILSYKELVIIQCKLEIHCHKYIIRRCFCSCPLIIAFIIIDFNSNYCRLDIYFFGVLVHEEISHSDIFFRSLSNFAYLIQELSGT